MIQLEHRGAFVFATLAAPATRNALTDAMVSGLRDAVAHAESLPDTRALVIRGAAHPFCAGGDFSGFRSLMAAPAPAQSADPIAAMTAKRPAPWGVKPLEGAPP